MKLFISNFIFLTILIFANCSCTTDNGENYSPEKEEVDNNAELKSADFNRKFVVASSVRDYEGLIKLKKDIGVDSMKVFNYTTATANERYAKQQWRNSVKSVVKNAGLKISGYYGINKREGLAPRSTLKIGIDGKLLGNVLNYSEFKEIRRPHCKSHKEYRAAVVGAISSGLDDGVTSFLFDDPVKSIVSHACYCDLCSKNFTQFLLQSSAGERLIASIHDGPVETFHVRKYINTTWGPDLTEMRGGFIQSELFSYWKDFKNELAKDFYRDITTQIRDYAAKEHNQELYLHFNGWSFLRENRAMTLLDYTDGIWAEFEVNLEKPTPFDGTIEAFVKFFRGRGKLVSLFPSNSSTLIHIFAKKGSVNNFYKELIALCFASGGKYDYQRINILLKQMKARTQTIDSLRKLDAEIYDSEKTEDVHLQTEVFGTYTKFVKKHPDLFPEVNEKTNQFSTIAIMKTSKDFTGYEKDNSFRWIIALDTYGLPSRFILEGTGTLMADTFSENSLENIKTLVLLSKKHILTENQTNVLKRFTGRGGQILHVSNNDASAQLATGTETYKMISDISKDNEQEILSKYFGESPVQFSWNTPTYAGFEMTENKILIHLVNKNYSWDTDSVEEIENGEISLNMEEFGITDIIDVSAYSPDGSDFEKISFEKNFNEIIIKLPRISIYTILELSLPEST
ncbi:hypothetical protein MNBD_GAMMA25-841 [hydrothermal vent metagenome]|uniref:Uncharacterized protein n=1 Tax=hydrothermal vent metagenome TaxID=652676 RepID=A0A3B1B9F3_9ZZZZ